jgi:hypothetical protein
LKLFIDAPFAIGLGPVAPRWLTDQRAVDAEMLSGQKPLHPRLRQQRRQKPRSNFTVEQPVTVLRKR